MRSRLATIFVLCAWLFATGSQWDLVQTFAWGRMIATYTKTMPVTEAVRLTFTADNLCGICQVVAQAKQDAAPPATAATNPAEGKILLALTSTPQVILGLVELNRFSAASQTCPSADHPAPPSEPPRAA